MKYLMLVLMVVLVASVGCARCSFNVGVGYRSVPPTLPQPIIHQLKAMRTTGAIPPSYIDLLIKFLASGGLEAMFHQKNRTDLGVWVDFLVD